MAILSKTVILAPAVSRSAGNAERSSRLPAKGFMDAKKTRLEIAPTDGRSTGKTLAGFTIWTNQDQTEEILLGDVSGRDSPL